jgi:acyl-CoA synthetase (AMP-forming)/AMP-acid ligase II
MTHRPVGPTPARVLTHDLPALAARGARLADAATGEVLAGARLGERLAAAAAAYRSFVPGLVIVRAGLSLRTVLRYLGGWMAGRAVAMLDPALATPLSTRLIEAYEPAAVVGWDDLDEPAQGHVPAPYRAARLPELGRCWVREQEPVHLPHEDLAVLLATSGSTGSPKLVRLGRRAVLSNAHAIADALAIGAQDVAPTCLPLFYSYGLSVLNSHLVRGATLVIADGGFVSRAFWEAVDRYAATSLSGVPRSYQILQQMRWTPARNPSVKVLTQAGGRLDAGLIRAFHARMTEAGGRFHVMWGQAEAAPRMSVLPSDRLPDKLGSVGPALPGGRLSIRLDDGTETTAPHVAGEVVYRGPNVMLGYASSAADLAQGDVQRGELRTGDLGYLDEDGYLWLTGRLHRIGKVSGIRLNLDDVEDMARKLAPGSPGSPVAAVAGDDRVVVFCERLDDTRRLALAHRLADRLRVHRADVDVRPIERLPLLSNGKVDYRSMEALCR